jgi:hypothetical protein
MAETIDEITYDYEDEGKVVRRTLKKEVLTRGGWSTIMFLYEDLDRKTGKFGAPKVAIVRFKKWQGTFRKQSSFAISSEKQARQLMGVLEKWLPEMVKPGADAAEAGDDAPDSADE